MKKWIALLLALVMCLALCACGGGDPKPDGVYQADSDTYEYAAFRFADGEFESVFVTSADEIAAGSGEYEINTADKTIRCIYHAYRENDNFTDSKELVLSYSGSGDSLKLTADGETFAHTDAAFREFKWVIKELVGNTEANSRTYVYDDAGRLVDDGECQYTYNDDGTIATSTYGKNVTTYEYDSNGVLHQKHHADGATTVMFYDDNGVLTSEAYDGVDGSYIDTGLTLYEYDDNGFLVKREIQYFYPSKQPTVTTYVYENDAEGNPISFTVDGRHTSNYVYTWIEITE